MKSSEIGSIALKTIGIYWLVQAVLHLIHGVLSVLAPFTSGNNITGLIWTLEIIDWILVGITYTVIGYFCTFRTKYVMDIVKIRDSSDEPLNQKEPATNIEALAFSLLGIYFAVPALSGLIPQLIKLWSLRQSAPVLGMIQESYFRQNWFSLLDNIIEMILGIVLIMGSARLTKLWRRLRPLSE